MSRPSKMIRPAFGVKKPAPEIFRRLIDQLQIDPAQSWYVGDDPRADIWGAAQVGFKTCWVERYSPWPADLSRCYDARVDATADCWEVIARVA